MYTCSNAGMFIHSRVYAQVSAVFSYIKISLLQITHIYAFQNEFQKGPLTLLLYCHRALCNTIIVRSVVLQRSYFECIIIICNILCVKMLVSCMNLHYIYFTYFEIIAGFLELA